MALPTDFLAFLIREGDPDLFPLEWEKGKQLPPGNTQEWKKIVQYFKFKMSEASAREQVFPQGRMQFTEYFHCNNRFTFTRKLHRSLKPKAKVAGAMLLLATAAAATLPAASPIPLRYRYEEDFYKDIKNGIYPPKQWSEASYRRIVPDLDR